MAVNAAAGTPQYSGTFVPEIWSGKFLVKFYARTVCAAICNTDYEGEVKNQGDIVNIRQVPDMVISDYSKNQTLSIDRPEADIVTMPIDKAKYFNFICDDIDKHQTDVALMDSWSKDAAQQMKIEIDTGFLADVYSDAHASNKGATAGAKTSSFNLGASGSPLTVTKANILEIIVDCNTVLDEQDIPEEDRWMVIPPFFRGMILKSDLKDASLAGDGTSIMRNGRIGMIDRTTLYLSNLLTAVTDGANTCWHVMCGHKKAISFAAQMTKLETLRSESTFGELVRGLNVYGYKVLKTPALVDLYIKK